MTPTMLLNWILKLAAIVPFFYWLFGIFLEWLGVEPLVKINTQSGYVVLVLLLLNLLVGAIHDLKWLDIKWYRFVYMSRRYLGIGCGFYVVLHFLTYLAKESFALKGWEQIITKNYLIAASVSGSIILILTLTSNNFSMRLLKKNWKRLHRLIYLASVTVLFHIFLIEKANLALLAILVFPVALLQLIRLFKFMNKFRLKYKIFNKT